MLKMKVETCEVGMFRLPGIVFDKEEMTDALYEEIKAWAELNNCGKPMTPVLWSFRSESKRDWFILKWAGDDNRNEEM